MAENEQSPWSLRNIDFEKLGEALAVVHTPASADEYPAEPSVAESTETRNVGALVGKGWSLIGQEFYQQALEVFDEAVTVNEVVADAHRGRGAALMGLVRLEEALTSFDISIGLEPEVADDQRRRGEALAALGRNEDAKAAFEEESRLRFGPPVTSTTEDTADQIQSDQQLFDPTVSKSGTVDVSQTEPDAADESGASGASSEANVEATEVPSVARSLAERVLELRKQGNEKEASDIIIRALSLDRGIFAGYDLSGVNLIRVDMQNANFVGTNFAEAELSGANLTSSDLGYASFVNAYLQGANFAAASLAHANLRGAQLTDAILEFVDLSGAQLEGASGITFRQLASARSLVGATMPEGITLRDDKDVEDYLRSMQSTQS